MKKRSYKPAATVLAFLMLVLPGALSARERRGANLVITLKDGHNVAGELIAVKPNSLLLYDFAGKDQSVDLVGISSIRIVKESKAGAGGAYGALAGALIGGLFAALTPLTDWGTGHTHASAGGVILVASAAGAAGGLIGLGIGSSAGKDKIIRLGGKSETEKMARTLAYLRGKARIRDFK